MENTFRVKLLGVRGTVPVHGPEFSRFGGGTGCVLVRAGGENIILDAGTGLSGRAFRDFCPGKRFSLLLSHSHVDHLMGFPIFPPLFDGEVTGSVYLKTRQGLDARNQAEALMAPPLWPIRTDGVKARLDFLDVPAAFSIGAVQVDTLEVAHPGGCTAYKLTLGEKSLVYATDFEAAEEAIPPFLQFAGSCTLLLLDGQYTDEEYPRCRGFGHNPISRSVELARRSAAQQTIIIHHDPNRTDEALLALEQTAQAICPTLRFGRGGEEVIL